MSSINEYSESIPRIDNKFSFQRYIREDDSDQLDTGNDKYNRSAETTVNRFIKEDKMRLAVPKENNESRLIRYDKM